MMGLGVSEFRIRRIAADLLGDQLIPIDEVIDAVVDSVTDDVIDPVELDVDRNDLEEFVEDVLLDSGELIEVDDRWGHLTNLLAGTQWVCPVTATDASSNRLPAVLLPFLTFLVNDHPLDLVDRNGMPTGRVTLVEVDEKTESGEIDHLAGPEGWLADSAGRFACFSFGSGRTVSVDAVSEAPAADPRLVEALAIAFDLDVRDEAFESVLVNGDDGPIELVFGVTASMVLRLIGTQIELLRDAIMPPIATLAEAGGFETGGHLIARSGFDWDALRRWQSNQTAATIWNLDPAVAEILQATVEASLMAIESMSEPTDIAETDATQDAAAMKLLAASLEIPGMATAFWGEHRRRRTPPEHLVDFLGAIVGADDANFGGARWVLARCLDHLGRPLEAEALLRECVGGQLPDHPRAMQMLAGFESDRGDAPAAIAALKRSDVFDVDDPDELEHDPFLQEIGQFAANRPKATASRNDPCPCGSGKKYKKCHLGNERHDIADRANWLFDKMARYVRDNRFADTAHELSTVMAEASTYGWQFEQLVERAKWLPDLVLARTDAGAAFADERSALLPDDEALLAAQWALIEPGVFEVHAFDDDSLDLTNLRTGDHLVVSNVTPAERTQIGMVLYGRVLPVGDTWRAMSGFVGVPANEVEAMIRAVDIAVEGDPIELAAHIGRTFAPPTLTNTDGERPRFHIQIWSVVDVDDIHTALVDAGFDADHDGRYSLLDNDDGSGERTVLASLVVDGETLTVESNSDERASAVIERLTTGIAGIRMVDHDYFESEEIMRRSASGNTSSLRDLHEADPATRAIIVAEVARHESAWLDMEIPALGGLTPRQSADDPVARESLIRLLATFPETDEPTRMSPARLRGLLGI